MYFQKGVIDKAPQLIAMFLLTVQGVWTSSTNTPFDLSVSFMKQVASVKHKNKGEINHSTLLADLLLLPLHSNGTDTET